MTSTIQKWGNSLALRIPGAVAKGVKLHKGEEVEISVQGGKILVSPRGRRKYSLGQLLKKVTSTNRHSERDWGKAAGGEVW